jgi:hypothetical protein
VDENIARSRLAKGLYEIDHKAQDWERRENYYRGTQDLPFAPEGVNQEYLELREMASANWLGLAMDTPVQRLRAEGFRTGRDEDADQTAWDEVWQPNKLDARQRIVYSQMMVHGRGLMSVWRNPNRAASPRIAVESDRRVHLEPDPENPFETKWAVKLFSVEDPKPSPTVLPEGVSPAQVVNVAVVYDGRDWMRFEQKSLGGEATAALSVGSWEKAKEGSHGLGTIPFVAFDNNQDADGKPHSAIEPLMAAQDAITTIRFNTLLAMQFSAFRQRVFTGFDPVVRDDKGNVVWRKDANGDLVLDDNGQPIPITTSPGRVGVDRALVFPGELTKVFDLQESNLKNYIEVLGEFLTQFFAIAQIPPQYLLTRMANLSGDALAGAESTLSSLVVDLQTSVGESLESVMRLANVARGDDEQDVASYVIWAEAEARSFGATIDAITKLISVGLPTQAGLEMVPGATQQKVKRWMDLRDQEVPDPFALLDPATRAAVKASGATEPPASA